MGELAVTNANGIPLHVEHDTSAPSVGHVLCSYEGTRGELRVIGQVSDQATARRVESGELRGLSLGTDCVQSMDGQVLSRSQRELSLCDEGRRSGTWVTHIGDRQVHSVAAFSAKGTRRRLKFPAKTITPSTPLNRQTKPLSTNPHIHPTMADTAVVDVADTVTKQTYDETKALADERATKLAAAEARLQAYETRERAQLQSYQPAMESLVKELASEYGTPETKAHFDSFSDWTRTCSERANLDTQLQLGTVIHACASKLKRTREEASVQSATADQLATMAKENEGLKENLASKEARIGELSSSLKEITSNSEKLQIQLERAGALQEKFDFSKTASREADAPKGAAAADGIVTKTTENASKLGSVQVADPSAALFSFVNGNSSSVTGRFMPAASNHSLLGAPSGSDIGLGSALRPM